MSKVLQVNTNNLNTLKMHYTALNAFSVDLSDNKLVFGNTKLDTSEISLDEIVLMLDPTIFQIFIKNKYYAASVYNRIIYTLLTQGSKAHDDNEKSKEQQLINYFTKDYIQRLKLNQELHDKYTTLFEENNIPNSIKIFLKDTDTAKLLIDYAYSIRNKSEIANTIITNYERNMIQWESQNNNNELNSKSQTKEKELTRVRTNSKIDEFLRDEEEYINNQERFDSAGFTSILAIVAVIIAFGVYIAVLSLG